MRLQRVKAVVQCVIGAFGFLGGRFAEKRRMNDSANHAALRVLRSFFSEMHDWEVEGFEAENATDLKTTPEDKRKADRTKRRNQLEVIFEKYCEVGRAAKRLMDKGLAFQKPPTYDPEKEIVVSVEVKRAKVVVETTKQKAGLRFSTRYELVERDGSWKLRDNSKYTIEGLKKWETRLL
jgi:hypothetical protein